MLAAKRRHASAKANFQLIANQSAAAPNKWRRFDLRSALVTTALGTGVLMGASLITVGPALACVDVTHDPNSVSCDDTQTTTDDTLDVTAAGADSDDNDERHYLFSANGDIQVEITTDGDIDGFGLAVTTTEAGSAIIVDHQGSIVVDAGNTPTEGGTAAFNLTTDGGNVTYTGNGSVANDDGGIGLMIDTGAGAGNIAIGEDGSPVTPDYLGFYALRTNSGTGDQDIYLDGGRLVATNTLGDGIFATSTTGDINIELTGNTQITTTVASPNLVWGVRTESAGGATTISSDADMGSAGFELHRGISSFSTGGPIDITQTGGTIMATNAGIFAETSGATGDISITTNAGSLIDMTGGTGIVANQFATSGGATVTVHGDIAGSDTGVSARITDAANSDDVTVTASGSIEATVGHSISAITDGTGNATVNLLDGAYLEGGVLAQSTTGNAGIVAGDNVTVLGNSPGLWSITAGGDATVVVGDNALVTGSSGIVVDQTLAGGAGDATVVVGDNGEIIGDGTDPGDDYDGNGIFAGNQGTGVTSVTTGTGTSVTGEANGIVAFQTDATNTNDMTITTDGPVTGNGGIPFVLSPYTDAFVAAGLPTTGLGIGVSNEGTGDIIVTTGDTVIGENVGIQTLAAGGGDTTITTNGAVTGGAVGISATADGGNIAITANDDVTGGSEGIVADASGAGTVTVTTTGNVTGTAGVGIQTFADAGATVIDTSGEVTGGTDGIVAISGAGNVTITTSDAVEGEIGTGILASVTSGDIQITADGDVTGGEDGILAQSTTGNIAIAGGGNITGDSNADGTGDGINADSSGGGDVEVDVTGDVTGASGIVLRANLAGAIDVTTGGAVEGTDGDGINTFAVDGDTTIVTNGTVSGSQDGIDAEAFGGGSITITATDTVTGTAGDGIVTSTFAGDTTITTNAVTGGDDGIDATTGLFGNITITTNGPVVGTAGDGIVASALFGDIEINANADVTGGEDGIDATTTGTGAVSILANGTVDGLTGDGIVTSAVDGNTAIETNADVTGANDGIDATATGAGAVSILANGNVDGFAGDGIVTSAVDGNTAIRANADVTGADDGIDATATGAGNIGVRVFDGAEVTGLTGAGVRTDTAAGEAMIDNAGLIQGAFAAISGATSTVLEVVNQAGGLIRNLSDDIGDLAISVTGTGNTEIENDGTIRGRIELGSGDDTFINRGLWATTGVSDFGAGNDTITNTGRLSVAEQAAVAEITHLSNLESFTNASTGVIDMVDNNAPNVRDTLTIDGVYTGEPGSIVQMDLALVSGDPQLGSDLLILDGANPAQGTSDFLFNIVSTGVTATTENANRVAFAGGQLVAPVTVVENRGNLTTSSGDDDIPLARSGLINYDLVRTAAVGGDFQVVSQLDAGLAGGLLLPIPATLSTVAFTTQRTPNPITATCIDPDNKATAQGGWVRGLAGEFKTSAAGKASTGGVTSDLESDNRTRFKTLQGGFDHVWCNLGNFASTLHLGVTVGQTWGDSFQKDPDPVAGVFGTDVAFDTFFVGPYAAFTRGNFAAQASLRFDYHSLELSNPTVGLDVDGLDVKAEGISGSASMSYDFELATLTLTPDVGVNVSNTEIDRFDVAGGTVVLDDLWSVMGHVGVTARTQPLGVADNLFVVPFASATLYHEFIDNADGRFDIGGTVIEAESNRVGTFGQVGIGANAVRLGDVVAGRPTLFGGARFDLQVGERIEGATATVFGRVQF
jgi:hypothetical protein